LSAGARLGNNRTEKPRAFDAAIGEDFMKSSRLLTASLLGASALTFAMPAQAQRVDNIVVFGDSYADDGNAFELAGINPVTTLVYTTGRFSGGTNYIDTLADLLGATTENFAIGGAKTDNTNVNAGLPGFQFEVQAFLAGGLVPAFPTGDGQFDENDLLAISIGGNDARAYELGGGLLAGAPAAAATAAANATFGMDQLVDAGAQTISFLAGDTGRLPEVQGRPDPALAASIRSSYSTTFNTAMQSTLAGYAADGVIVHYLDLNLLLDNVIANPAAYGITNGLACPAFQPPSPASQTCLLNAGGYLFYGDALHLTSDGFKIVGQYVAAQLTAPLLLQGPSDVGLDVARQFARTLTTRMDTGSPRDGDTSEGLKFFIVGDGYGRHLDAGERNLDYRASGVGATAGVQYGFGSGVAGVAVNYSKPKANFTSDAADVDSRSIQVGGYAGFGVGGAFAQAYAGYGWDKHDLKRAGVVEGMEADPKGHHFLVGAKGGYLMPMGIFRVGPVIALDYAKAKVDGYTETGDPVLTLNVDSLSYKSLRGSAGIEVRSDFEGGGVQLRPFVAAVVEKDFSGDERTIRFAQTSAPTIVNSFQLSDASKKAYGRFSAGFGAAILDGVSLDIAGSATVGKDQGEEASAHLGLRIGF
jgi:outer membrane lipase/esterase